MIPVHQGEENDAMHCRIADGDNILVVSAPLYRTLKSLGIQSAEESLAYLESFPTAIAASMNVSLEEVGGIEKTMRKVLRDHLPDALINPAKHPKMSYGARMTPVPPAKPAR